VVAIPQEMKMTPQQAFTRLQEWFAQKGELATLKTSEVLTRKALAAYFFPALPEGVSRLDLGGGFDLKLTVGITRSVDEAALAEVKASQAKKLKLNLDTLFPTKPTLSTSEYRKLNEEQRLFVDTLLDIKECTPSMDIVPQATEEVAARAEEHKAVAIATKIAVTEIHVVKDPTKAKPGQYYTDAGAWWCLTDDYEWAECADPSVPAVTTVPKKRARKAAAKKAAK